MLSFDVFWRWHSNVGPMVWAKRIYGYFLGMWLVFGNLIRRDKSSWTIRRSYNGHAKAESRHSLWHSLRNSFSPGTYGHSTSQTYLKMGKGQLSSYNVILLSSISDNCIQYFVGHAISIPKFGPCWSSLVSSGGIKSWNTIVVCRSTFSRRKQT